MMAAIKNPTPYYTNNLNARVKFITPSIKDVIKNVMGNDLEIPQIIYNRIEQNLTIGNNTNAVLKTKLDDGSSYWIKNRFEPSTNNRFKNNFTLKTELLSKTEIEKSKKLYQKLNRIEKHISVNQAGKFLEGYLEEQCITFNELVSF